MGVLRRAPPVRAGAYHRLMVISRTCDQCGSSFTPRREHARFCSARCRVVWNREHMVDPVAEVKALSWSIIAMADVTERLAKIPALDRPRAFAVVSEAVWWVTIVDATLVRYHPESYDQALNAAGPHVEATLAGLRFVRNQIGQGIDHVDFIHPAADSAGGGPDRVGGWAWSQQPEPACTQLSAQGKAWELARYRAYQTQLAGHPVGETFTDASAFLNLAASRTSDTEDGLLSDRVRALRRGL